MDNEFTQLIDSFITIDFEGDTSSLRSTFDEDTIPWCFTVSRPNGQSITFCTKLKETLDSIRRDAVSHKDCTKIPYQVFGSRPVIEVDGPRELMVQAAKIVGRYALSRNMCLFKSYWDPETKSSFYYDRELMRICLDRYEIGTEDVRKFILDRMMGVHVKREGKTHSYYQVHRGECVTPDEFILRGIEHNVADACTLAYNVSYYKTFTDDPNYHYVLGVTRKVPRRDRNEKPYFRHF